MTDHTWDDAGPEARRIVDAAREARFQLAEQEWGELAELIARLDGRLVIDYEPMAGTLSVETTVPMHDGHALRTHRERIQRDASQALLSAHPSLRVGIDEAFSPHCIRFTTRGPATLSPLLIELHLRAWAK